MPPALLTHDSLTSFLRSHLWHLLVLPPAILAVTALHEAAHAIAVLACGGTVTDISIWPSSGEWGHTSYVMPDGQSDRTLIALAPYLLWLTIALVTTWVAARKIEWRPAIASVLFVWMFVVPWADIGYAALSHLAGARNDFWSAFGNPSAVHAGAALAFLALAVSWGYPLQQRLYRDRALSKRSYGVGVAASLLALFGLVLGLPR